MNSRVRTALQFFSMFAISASLSCAEARPAVDRTGEGGHVVFVEKSWLAEKDASGRPNNWYLQRTVIDTPVSNGFTFPGEQANLEKVRWEIQENLLIARRMYEFVSGAEGAGIDGSANEAGAPIAMYKIREHFDIRRDYNPTTGEELNVIVRNTTDRPWNQRRFMEVDWSQNLVTSNDFLAVGRMFEGITLEPMTYHVVDPNDPNAPVFQKNAKNELTYFDITNKVFAKPSAWRWDNIEIPVCWFREQVDCTASEVTVRNSFLRIDPDAQAQYQPSIYTGDRMERYGYFVSRRLGYDRQYGANDASSFRLANRHNIWVESYKKQNTSFVVCTADSQCGGGGSLCDLDYGRVHATDRVDFASPTSETFRLPSGQIRGACTIPFRERKVRTFAYHVTKNFPDTLMPDANFLTAQWNKSFVDTVSSLRENECIDNGGTDCASERTRADHQNVFVACHNPVTASDHPACGGAGTSARPGDLRYSILGWVSEPDDSSPLGYGPSSADPETGEIVMANAFVYGAAVETLATNARDLVALLNGDVTEAQVTDGQLVRDWIERQTAPAARDLDPSRRPAADHVVPVDGNDAEEIARAMDTSKIPKTALSRALVENAGSRSALTARLAELGDRGVLGRGAGAGDALLNGLRNSPIERMMMNSEFNAVAGLRGHAHNAGEIDRASPLRRLSPRHLKEIQRIRNQMNAEQCQLGRDFADDGLLGLAQEIQRSATTGTGKITWYGVEYDLRKAGTMEIDYAKVREMIVHPIFQAVTAHEVGHTLGLRHNFTGSTDALNYEKPYWDLRVAAVDGDVRQLRSRAYQPVTSPEIAGRIREHQHSSVMDYGNNFVVTDANGVGLYDTAAIKMGYGDLVEVFASVARRTEAIAAYNNRDWIAGYYFDGSSRIWDYTRWPQIVGGVEAMYNRRDVPYRVARTATATSVTIRPNVTYDGKQYVLVPHRFATDDNADLDFPNLRYDSGPDIYEGVQSLVDSYWNYYPISHFRRGRIGFDQYNVGSRTYNRYFDKLRNIMQLYSLYIVAFGEEPSSELWTGQNQFGAYTSAVGSVLGLFTRVISSPEPGTYVSERMADGANVLMPGRGNVTVSTTNGRYLTTSWDFEENFWWSDTVLRAGFFYDKALALNALVDPEVNLVLRDSDSDVRQYQLNASTAFGPAIKSFYRGLLSEQWEVFAPRAVDGQVVYPTLAQIANNSMTGTPINPNASFSVQLYGAVTAMVYMSQTYDQDFLNRCRVWVRGADESIDVTRPTVTFTDPESGFTYTALSYPVTTTGPGGAPVQTETGVGARMLLKAQALATANADAELNAFIDNIDLVRQMTNYVNAGVGPVQPW